MKQKLIKKCKNCKEEFKVYPYLKNQKFCSKECYRKDNDYFMRGKTAWNKNKKCPWITESNKKRKNNKCLKCGSFIGVPEHNCKEIAKKTSETLKRKYKSGEIKPTMLGVPCPKIKRFKYKGISFRSSWEVIFAKFLDKYGFTWEYEPKRFHFKNYSKTYLPDFYVKEMNSYVEIKGRYTMDCRNKIYAFYQEYPDKNLIVIDNAKQIRHMEKSNEL